MEQRRAASHWLRAMKGVLGLCSRPMARSSPLQKKTAPKERFLFACSAQAVPEAGPLLWVAMLWQWCIFRAPCDRATGDAILALRSYAEVILPCLFAPANRSTKCVFSFPGRRFVVWPGSGFILRSKKRQEGEGACLIVVPRLWASLFNKVVHRICGKE